MTDRDEAMPEGKKRKKDRECGKCKWLFDCEGKAMHVERCLYFKERKNGRC